MTTDWEAKCAAMEAQLGALSNDLLESEKSLLQALVLERKLAKQLEEQLRRSEDKYEMAKQAMDSFSTKTLAVESSLDQLQQELELKNAQVERLMQQRDADVHVKRQLDDEVQQARLAIKQLTAANAMLKLKLDISEGGGGGV